LLGSFRIWSKRPMNGYSASCEVRPKIQGTYQPNPARPGVLVLHNLVRGCGAVIIAGCQPADKCVVAAMGLEISARMGRALRK
jgi:hypothetical protein